MRSSWAPTISQVIKPTKTTYRRLINIVLLLLLLLLLFIFNSITPICARSSTWTLEAILTIFSNVFVPNQLAWRHVVYINTCSHLISSNNNRWPCLLLSEHDKRWPFDNIGKHGLFFIQVAIIIIIVIFDAEIVERKKRHTDKWLHRMRSIRAPTRGSLCSSSHSQFDAFSDFIATIGWAVLEY